MEVNSLKGVGEKTASLLNQKGIYSLTDLINFFPISYNEYETQSLIDGKVQITGVIQTKPGSFVTQKGLNITNFMLYYNEQRIKITAFNQKFITFNYKVGDLVTINGVYNSEKENIVLSKIVNAQIETLEKYIPIYSHIKGLTSHKINIYINLAIEQIETKNKEDYVEVHNPTEFEKLKKSIYNLKYYEFETYLKKIQQQAKNKQTTKDEFKKEIDYNDVIKFKNMIPFELTESQNGAILKLYESFNKNILSSQLLLGDVGSGKTIVALTAAQMILSKNKQVAIMAPTSIVAQQIYNQVCYLLANYNSELLLGSTNNSKKNNIKNNLMLGITKIVVGTHTLLSDDVIFNDLGLIIIDEQHRFGVNQRQTLINKGNNAEYLSLSATPIPRSLAMTYFNILDLIIIDEKPKNRIEIDTQIFSKKTRNDMIEMMEEHLKSNNQVYVIAPNIDESEVDNVTNVVEVFEAFKKKYKNKYNIGLLHGYLKNKEQIINEFQEHKYDMLVATTVVEVGVDIKDATCIVILNAERFGVATLHQLRGRVGRSNKPSQCFLYSTTSNSDSKERLELLKKYNDGFILAEKDMSLRGSGDFFGVVQSGNPDFKIFNYETDQDIAQDVIEQINQNNKKK